MSEDEAHHISTSMIVNIVFNENTYQVKVDEDQGIYNIMEKFCEKAGIEFKENYVLISGGAMLNKNYTFNFYKTQIHSAGGVFYMLDKVPCQNVIRNIPKLYTVKELDEMIKVLQEVRDKADKKERKENLKFYYFLNSFLDNKRHYNIRRWERRMAKKAEEAEKAKNDE